MKERRAATLGQFLNGEVVGPAALKFPGTGGAWE